MQILWQDKKVPSRADQSLLGKEVKANYSNDSGVMSLMPFIPRVILFKQTQTMTYLDTHLTSFLLDYCKWEEMDSPQRQSRTEAFYRLIQVCKPALQYSLLHAWSGCNCLYCRWCEWHLWIPSAAIAFWEQPWSSGQENLLVQLHHLHGWQETALGAGTISVCLIFLQPFPQLSLIDGSWVGKLSEDP